MATATPAAIPAEGASTSGGATEDDRLEDSGNHDAKLEGKKKKFKPLEAMRKLFKGGRKRSKSKEEQVSIVSLKAKSTGALHIEPPEDDDDGGFKYVQPPMGLRSKSDDSIFSQEQKDLHRITLQETAVSMEGINRSAFNNELYRKIKDRQGGNSDDDDGLPRSPMSPLTADLLLGDNLKAAPSKSLSRESDRSLLSMDSENEEEDLFLSSWQSSVATVTTRDSFGSGDPIDMNVDFDFAAVKGTESLVNEGAKHKIHVRPPSRRASSHAKKRPQKLTAALPRLKEETGPTRALSDEGIFDVNIDSADCVDDKFVPKKTSRPVDIPIGPATQTKSSRNPPAVASKSLSPLSQTILSSSPSDEPKAKQRTTSGSKTTDKQVPDTVSSDLSQTFDKIRRQSSKKSEEAPAVSVKETTVTSTSGSDSATASTGLASTVKRWSGGHPEADTPQVIKAVQSPIQASSSLKESFNISRADSAKYVKNEASKAENTSQVISDPPKAIGSEVSKLASPKEDYKSKRQGRSKTLPEQPVSKDVIDTSNKDIGPSSEIKRSNSHNSDISSPSVGSSPTSPWQDPATNANKQPGKDPEQAESSEPEWMAMARKRKANREEKAKVESVKKSTDTTSTASKSFFKSTPSTNVKPATENTSASDAAGTKASFIVNKSQTKSVSTAPITNVIPPTPVTSRSVVSTSFRSTAGATSPTGVPEVNATPKASTSSTPSFSRPIASSTSFKSSSTTSATPTTPVSSRSFGSSSSSSSKPFSASPASIKPIGASSTPASVSKPLGASSTPVNVSKPLGTSSTAASVSKPLGGPSIPVNVSKPLGVSSTPASVSKPLGASSTPASVSKPLGASSTLASVSKPVGASLSTTISKGQTFTTSSSPATRLFGQSATSASTKSSESTAPTAIKTTAITRVGSMNSTHLSTKSETVTPVVTKTFTNSPLAKSMSVKSEMSKTTSDNVSSTQAPPWKAQMSQKKQGAKDVKIEIIDREKNQTMKTPEVKSTPVTIQEKITPVVKLREKTRVEKCAADVSSNRSSKVLDMVKNFQNLQVS